MHIIKCVRVPDNMSLGFKHAEPLGAEGGKSQSLQHTPDMVQPNDTSVQTCGGTMCAGNMRACYPGKGLKIIQGGMLGNCVINLKSMEIDLQRELAFVFRLEALCRVIAPMVVEA